MHVVGVQNEEVELNDVVYSAPFRRSAVFASLQRRPKSRHNSLKKTKDVLLICALSPIDVMIVDLRCSEFASVYGLIVD